MSAVRLRQAVLAAADLEGVVAELQAELGLGEPFRDEAVAFFGLRNAVFALGDTFLEVVSPLREGTAAGRLLERRGPVCGYMLMFQVDELERARAAARQEGVREVFQIELDDISEVHLHPADMDGPIVSLSRPEPADGWRWGGPGWRRRSGGGVICGATVGVRDPGGTRERWTRILGEDPQGPGVGLVSAQQEGLLEVRVRDSPLSASLSLAHVRIVAE